MTLLGNRVDLLVDLPILALIVEISNWHSSPLGVIGGTSASSSANISSNRNLKLTFLATRWLYCGGGWSNSWSTNIGSNIQNLKLPFLSTTWLYWWWEGRSAGWSTNISSNSRNLILPFLATRWLYWGNRVDLLVDLPILALIVEISNWHSSPLCVIRGRSASWSANISSNSRNLKLTFFTTMCH